MKMRKLGLLGVLCSGLAAGAIAGCEEKEEHSNRHAWTIEQRVANDAYGKGEDNVRTAQKEDASYSLEDYVKAIGKIESNHNPLATRYEEHIDDWSFGEYQILTRTAKGLERKHSDLPRLGNSSEDVKKSLQDSNISKAYASKLFQEEFEFYKNPILAVAAYNSGHLTPRNARIQQQLNDLFGTDLATDGVIGRQSQEVVKIFQQRYGLEIDGKVGARTYETLQLVWTKANPDKPNPIGVVPNNRYTPNHVRKFEEALKRTN